MIRQSVTNATTPLSTATVATEARILFHRRKIAYIALAAITSGAYLYMATSLTSRASPTRSADTKVASDGGRIVKSNADTGQSNSTNAQSGPVSSSSATNTSTSQTTVTVNGQNVSVPVNGTLDTNVSGDGSDASVHISHTSSSSGTNQQSNTFTMEVNQ